MQRYKINKLLLERSHNYKPEMEHDACGVGLISSLDGKKSRKVVEYGIEALKAVWHRGAVDADGKSGDGAGISFEIPKDFFQEKIEDTGHKHTEGDICVGMIFLPRTDYSTQERSKTLVERNIIVNAIAPGPFDSHMLGKAVNFDYGFIAEMNPRKRIGTPQDMAGL